MKQKVDDVLLATALGPLVPFWGCRGDQCECGRPDDDKEHPLRAFGKHPRASRNWQAGATSDMGEIAGFIAQHPQTNFAVIAGAKSVVVDLDIRPGKNGVEWLSQYGTLPATPTVKTPSGGLHIYFQVPPDVKHLRSRNTVGVDFIRNGAVLAPGSKGRNGKMYQWLRSPLQVELAELPDWLRQVLYNAPRTQLEAPGASVGNSAADACLLSDEQAISGWKKTLVTEYKSNGKVDRSLTDLRRATSLAFWTGHNWDQYLRCWFASPEAHSGKKYGGNWLMKAVLIPAFEFAPDSNVTPRKRNPARPSGDKTLKVLWLHLCHPEWSDRQLADASGFDRNTVKRVRHRYPIQWSKSFRKRAA